MQIQTKFDVGDIVWVALVEKAGVPYAKIYGPVTIHKVEAKVVQTLGSKVDVVHIQYHFPQLCTGYWIECYLFATQQEALESVNEQLAWKPVS